MHYVHTVWGTCYACLTTAFCLGKGKGGKGSPQQNAQGTPANAGAKSGLKWIPVTL